MARSVNSDPLLSHNFALLDVPVAGVFPTAFPVKAVQSAINNGSYVGFQSISIPEMTVDMKDIREGNWPFTHHVPQGYVAGGECTIRFAVFNTNLDMWLWFQQVVWGRVAPRRSLIVVQTRNQKRIPQRMLWLRDCIPSTWRPATDLDASGSEVVMEELTLSVERVEILPLPVPQV